MDRTTVEIRVIDLATSMNRMRAWLDKHRFEPDVFRYTFTGDGPVIKVEFKYEVEADAFAEVFNSQA